MADRAVRVRLEAITSNFNRRISESSVLTGKFAHQLESADGRMANMVQTTLALAPALVPLGAAGIPAIAGLTAELGFAALATGTLVLGLNGVGDALKALDDYQLNPTAAHLQKLQQTLGQLGPAGGEFVLFLDDVEPKLKQLRNLAQAGLLPGAEEGIDHLLNLMPQLREIIFTTSTTLGDLFAEAGDNLDDPRWQDFFGFLQTRARPTLTEMGKSAGNFAEAFTNLVMAFDPLEQDFSTGLLHMSQQVRDWSDGLENTSGFQDLVDYVRTNGPRVLDLLGAFGEAFIQIIEAAAPVGSVVVPMLTEVLHIVGDIADSPAGPVLVGIAGAVGILGRSLALLKAVGLRGEGDSFIGRALGVEEVKGIPALYKSVSTATDELRVAQQQAAAAAVRARDAQTALIPTSQQRAAVTDYAAAQDRVRQAEDKLATAQQRRSQALRETLTTAGKGAALAAGFAVAQSGVADKIGLANTASLALIGTIGGPWGAAAGAAIGFTMDLAHANDDLEDSIKRANAAADKLDFSAWRAGIHDVLDANEKLQKGAKETSIFENVPKFTLQGFQNLGQLFGLGDSPADNQRMADQTKKSFDQIRNGAVELYAALNNLDPHGLKVSDDELTRFAQDVAPAFQRAGLNIQQLVQDGPLLDPVGWMRAKFAIHDWAAEMDSADGKSRAVGAALADLQSEMIPTANAAGDLADALDALFGTPLNQSAAIDGWINGLHELRKTLGETGKAITGNSDDALKNREAIRSSVKDLEDRVKADAAAGVSGDKIVKTLLAGRDAIIAQAEAAGKSGPEVAKYLDKLGLTPKNLVTVISTPGLLTATQKIQALSTLYKLTPAEVKTLISQLNMDHSNAQIALLSRAYHLTPKQIQTIIHLLGIDSALGQIHQISGAMAALRDKTVTIKVRQVMDAQAHAHGGIFTYAQGDVANRHMPELAGPGPTRIWREPETRGEAYIPLADDYRRPRAISIWEQTGMALGVQFRRYAMGGLTGAAAGADIDYDRLASAVMGNRLLGFRDTRNVLLSALRTALRETPIVQMPQADPTLLYGTS